MKLRFTPRAASDLEAIHTYIAKDNPDAARLLSSASGALHKCSKHSRIWGYEGVVAGTLEHTVSGLAYVIVYRVETGDGDEVVVVSIYHGRQERS